MIRTSRLQVMSRDFLITAGKSMNSRIESTCRTQQKPFQICVTIVIVTGSFILEDENAEESGT